MNPWPDPPEGCQPHGAFLLFEGDPYEWRHGQRTQWFIDYHRFGDGCTVEYYGYDRPYRKLRMIQELLRMMDMLDHTYFLGTTKDGYRFCPRSEAEELERIERQSSGGKKL